jgi:hypothetical protein
MADSTGAIIHTTKLKKIEIAPNTHATIGVNVKTVDRILDFRVSPIVSLTDMFDIFFLECPLGIPM